MRLRLDHMLAPLVAVLLTTSSSIALAANPAVWVGAGPTGTSDQGFRGGWGGTAALVVPLHDNADFVLRGDLDAMPFSASGGLYFPLTEASAALGLGEAGMNSRQVNTWAFYSGVRLHPRPARARAYLDAQVGVGHVRNPFETRSDVLVVRHPMRDDTNVALSFGAGVELRAFGNIGTFADLHYDRIFVDAAPNPMIPIRLGIVAH